jgi:hypothetical protein
MENELHKNSGVKAFIKGVMNADEQKYNKKLISWLGPLPKELRESITPIINTGVTREELIKILKDMNLDTDEDSVQTPSKPTEKEYHQYDKRKNPTEFKVGDVLMHPVFKHPYVLLKDKGDFWICGLLTTETNCKEILEKCQSRFFTDNYFTRVKLTVTEPYGSFMNTYENKKHLKKVTKKLKQTL